MSSNGSHLRRLYTQPSYFAEPDNGPLWSPDGEHIVFDSNRPTKAIQTFYGISVIDANGGHLHVLETSGEEPAWQPVP
jgi:Tol biopolymer transport system component